MCLQSELRETLGFWGQYYDSMKYSNLALVLTSLVASSTVEDGSALGV